MGHQAMKKFDSKIGRFDTSTCMTNRRTKTALWVASQGKIYEFSHYVVLIVCFCYTLLINDCLV